MPSESAPEGLSPAALALWDEVVSTYSLDPAELVILSATARTLDELERVEGALADGPVMVVGSRGQPVPNPLLAESRAHRKILESLVRSLALPLPGEVAGRIHTPQAKASASARWGRQRRLGVVKESGDGAA